jgi:uncharacterized protein (DUF2267 family)
MQRSEIAAVAVRRLAELRPPDGPVLSLYVTSARGTFPRRAIRATLTALAERVSAKEARDLAAQFPVELKGPLLDGAGPAQQFGFGEFVRHVAESEGMSPSEALHHSRAVMHVLMRAVTGGELDDIRGPSPRTSSRCSGPSRLPSRSLPERP